jgi:hypothetical protein
VDTNHSHADASHAHESHVGIPVESDGITYRGIVWFVGVLFVTALVIELAMFGLFRVLNHQIGANDPGRPPLAAPAGQLPPAPNLLFEKTGSADQNEPGYLRQFREREEAALYGYSVDKAAGTAKIPIARAKELLLQRGLPSRTQGGNTATPAKGAPAKSAPAK